MDSIDMNFTKRETEVAEAISFGFNSKEISDRLDISIHTVETHRKNLLRKLNAKNTAHLMRKSIAVGLIKIVE